MLGSLKNIFGSNDASKSGPPSGVPDTSGGKAAPSQRAATGHVRIPLTTLFDSMPSKLTRLVLRPPGDGAELKVPMETILPQLGSGSIKVPFLLVYSNAPDGTFQRDAAGIDEQVDLPLALVLPQVPRDLMRRKEPKSPVPEVSKADFVGSAQSAAPKPELERMPEPTPAATPQLDTTTSSPDRIAITLAKIIETAPTEIKSLIPDLASIAGNLEVPAEIVLPQLAKGKVQITAAQLFEWSPANTFSNAPADPYQKITLPLQEVLAKAGSVLKRKQPTKKLEGFSGQNFFSDGATAPKTEPEPAAPLFAPTPSSVQKKSVETTFEPAIPVDRPVTQPRAIAPGAPTGFVSIALTAVLDHLPDAIKGEAQRIAKDTTIQFPANDLGNVLKTGKINFTWSQLIGWMKPAQSSSGGSGGTQVNLPLKAVVGPFMAAMRQNPLPADAESPKEDIAGMFISKSTTATPPPSSVADTTIATKSDIHLGELLGDPDKRNWTPMEIVQRVAGLPGVSGSFISLLEGQIAAADMSDTKFDLVAFKIPKLYRTTAEQVEEMNLGQPSYLSFSVEGVPWLIFKVGSIFFTVQGRSGDLLPVARLQSIAIEIGHQRK